MFSRLSPWQKKMIRVAWGTGTTIVALLLVTGVFLVRRMIAYRRRNITQESAVEHQSGKETDDSSPSNAMDA